MKNKNIKNKKQKSKIIGFNIVEVVIIIIISSAISIIATGVITTNNNSTKSGTSYSELLNDEKIRSFLDTYTSVINNYYGEVDKDKVIDSAIDGMMDYLGDKYSMYLDDYNTEILNDKLQGTYKGIGVSISEDNTISDVFEDSPAASAGLKEGDKIIEVNGKDVKDKKSTEVIEIINEDQNNIKLKILRGDEEKEFDLKMSDVLRPTIASGIIDFQDKKVGYLYIESFSVSLTNQVKKALDKFDKESINGLIIDLRKNTGGYLTVAQTTSNLFLEKNKLIYSLETKKGNVSIYDESDEHKTYPIVVVVDEVTASAAEILTASLKDSYGAKVVGKKTYGKGLVQQTQDLNDGSMVKYSTAKWLRPNGECVEGNGIEPDFKIEDDTKADNKTTDNIYIDKALEVLFR